MRGWGTAWLLVLVVQPLLIVRGHRAAHRIAGRASMAPVHARFMASTALLLVDPVLARIMFVHLPPLPSLLLYQAVTFTLLAIAMALMVRSLPPSARGRNGYRNYCLGAVSTLALYFVVPHVGAWLAFVHWFRALPLT